MSKKIRAGSKDLRDLQRRFRPGFFLVADGKAKAIVMGPKGPVRHKDGRILGMPNSPNGSTVRIVERKLKDAGVIE